MTKGYFGNGYTAVPHTKEKDLANYNNAAPFVVRPPQPRFAHCHRDAAPRLGHNQFRP